MTHNEPEPGTAPGREGAAAFVLRLDGLSIGARGGKELVSGVDIVLRPGERAALVGESGSGKTVTSLSVLRLGGEAISITSGSVLLDGEDLTGASERRLERVRGARAAMIYQDPLSCLNPVRTIGNQLAEAVRAHQDPGQAAATERAVALLDEVGVPEPRRRLGEYPHQFSGGMRQRVMIAIAIACAPDLLIADEPTTALDVTTQARILRLLSRLSERHGMAVLFITHDLAVAASLCESIYVMRDGRVVEHGPLRRVLADPGNAYTGELLRAVVTVTEPVDPPDESAADPEVLVRADDLVREFGTGVRAVDGVSLAIRKGETFGLVGESGSGKSTLSQLLLGLDTPDAGSVSFRGTRLGSLGQAELRGLRRHMQVVLQDPIGSLNRRKTVAQIVGLPLAVHQKLRKSERSGRVVELLDLVGLPAAFLGRYPKELSGGQCQRVNIARAIALEPEFLVLDEAVSAVDVVIQAQILSLLRDLQRRLGLTYLFVSHDLAVVRYLAPRLAVMRHGRIVETGGRDEVFGNPRHEYTRELLSAIPRLDPAFTGGQR